MDQIPEGFVEEIDPQDEQERLRAEEEIQARIEALAESLLSKRAEAIEGRASSGIERQWREDQMLFDGKDVAAAASRGSMVDYATGDSWIKAKDAAATKSSVVVNIVRGKCETAEGRFTEIQLPTDDRNWGLKTTPIPESQNSQANPESGMLQGMPGTPPGMPPQEMPMQGAPMAPEMQGVPPDQAQMPVQMDQAPSDDYARDEESKKRAAAMELEIEDQLNECDFNGECRKVVRQAVVLGTGVLKGPNVVKRLKKSWVEQSDGVDSVHVLQVKEDFKPASKQVDIWNVYPDPNCGSDIQKGAYIWERDHLLPREIRSLIGVPGYLEKQIRKVLEEEPVRTVVQVDRGNNQKANTIKTGKGAPYERWEYHGDVNRDDLAAMGCTCPDGESDALSAVVVFINDRPIKAQLNTLDTGDLPYDFFQWVPQDDSPWGLGEPRKLMWVQRIMNGAWRMMMDNSGDSAGAQYILGKDIIPEDGNWEFSNKKRWIDTGDSGNINNSFAQFQIQSNQEQYQSIIELAMRFADLESGTPMLAQGEKGSSPETLGGMKILMDSADTSRRRQVKQWDDQVTRKHITRYYHWNMQYNPKPQIKGDFDVDARGTSVLLVRDETAQSLMQVLQLRADPEVNIQVDWGKVIQQLFKARHLDVLKPDNEIEAARQQESQNAQPKAPQVEVAQIRTEADKAIRAEDRQFEAAENQRDREVDLLTSQLQGEIERLKLNGKTTISFDEIKAMLAKTTMTLNTQKMLAGTKSPQVANPAVEPVGRAPAGQAFQR
jgi:hypothetical protein